METSVNNKCMAFTSPEQSKKLATILPHESADCFWDYDELQKYHRISWFEDGYEKDSQLRLNENNVCAWSLAALLSVLPAGTRLLKSANISSVGDIKYHCDYPKGTIHEWYDNPVDACYEMVMRLNELKML